MPAIIDGRAVAGPVAEGQHVSWEQLARDAGVPSWGWEAEWAMQGWRREQAQQRILEAYNRQREAA